MLQDTLTAAELALTAYNQQSATTASDQNKIAALQTQLTTDQSTQNNLGISLNSAIDAAISDLNAAKVTVVAPVPPASNVLPNPPVAS
jgi:hypothetical protein